jgi:ribosomal protein L37AE/L43A
VNLKPSKKTKKNLGTIFNIPKSCNRCNSELKDKSALMMGIGWECSECSKIWTEDMSEII